MIIITANQFFINVEIPLVLRIVPLLSADGTVNIEQCARMLLPLSLSLYDMIRFGEFTFNYFPSDKKKLIDV